MTQDFLSQEEVDALLSGVTGESETVVASGATGPRTYDFATQERIVRGRMPTLEIINERFARLLRIELFNFARRNAEIAPGPVKVQKYSDFLRNLHVPTNLNIVAVRPLRGNALVVCDPNFVFALVDTLFGGDGRFHSRVEGREFTPTEIRIIQKLLGSAFDAYARAWAGVYPLKLEYLRSEMHTQFANVANPNEIVVSTTFSVELGQRGGDMHVCIPYAIVEPIRDVLYSTLQGDHSEPDKRWVTLLRHLVQDAEVQLSAALAHVDMTVGDLIQMKVGDVITFDPPRCVTADVDGVPLFEGRYGSVNNRYALKVERFISRDIQDSGSHDDHANHL